MVAGISDFFFTFLVVSLLNILEYAAPKVCHVCRVNIKNSSASPLCLARCVPLTWIHSVQLIVVQLLGHSLGTSTRANFEGALIAQVMIYKLAQ